MAYLALNLFIFIICGILHIIIHRFFAKRGILTLKTALIFLPGLFISIYISGVLPRSEIWWNVSIPYSGVIFYILMVGILIIFYTTPSFSSISPSTMILRLLKKNGKMSFRKLKGYFSDESLIVFRLKDLLRDGLIFLKKDKFRVTPKGNRIIKVIDIYRKIFGWRTGG